MGATKAHLGASIASSLRLPTSTTSTRVPPTPSPRQTVQLRPSPAMATVMFPCTTPMTLTVPQNTPSDRTTSRISPAAEPRPSTPRRSLLLLRSGTRLWRYSRPTHHTARRERLARANTRHLTANDNRPHAQSTSRKAPTMAVVKPPNCPRSRLTQAAKTALLLRSWDQAA